MATEIERKFLVRREAWHPVSGTGVRYRQGYLAAGPSCTVRVRVSAHGAFLTVKGATSGIARAEYEYAIPPADAEEMLATLCSAPLIDKVRYRVPHAGRVWEVDEFEGANAGLLLAEIELPAVDAPVDLPPWAGREVSGDARFFNSYLAAHPYAEWRHEAPAP